MRFEKPMPDSTEPRELRTDFHVQLDELDGAFTDAARQLATQIPILSRQFLAADESSINASRELSIQIGEICEQIADDSFVLLALESPVLAELRQVIALVRATGHLERTASLIRHVCQTLDHADPRLLPDPLQDTMAQLAARSAAVFSDSVTAWADKSPNAVTQIDEDDRAVDRLRDQFVDDATTSSRATDELLVIGLIARYYERIADHGVEIARDAAFVATGERVPVGAKSDG